MDIQAPVQTPRDWLFNVFPEEVSGRFGINVGRFREDVPGDCRVGDRKSLVSVRLHVCSEAIDI